MYDIVGSLSTEQSWGSAKVAGLVHFGNTFADIIPATAPAINTTSTWAGLSWAA